jgi:xanthine dehydrogenase accessory factor
MKQAVLDAVLAARAKRQAIAVVTDLASGDQRIVARRDAAKDALNLDETFRFDQSGIHRQGAREFFVHVHNPPLRLVIVGAVHIAQAVIPVARLAGYDVIVIDPRGAFATGARFPDIDLHAEWPDEVIPKIGLDVRTAMIALTHDPKIDDPALTAALKSDVFYIGALGSKKTHASRSARLAAHGFGENELARIHGPIGLAIGAKGAPEIAIAIMAEMTRALRLGE